VLGHLVVLLEFDAHDDLGRLGVEVLECEHAEAHQLVHHLGFDLLEHVLLVHSLLLERVHLLQLLVAFLGATPVLVQTSHFVLRHVQIFLQFEDFEVLQNDFNVMR